MKGKNEMLVTGLRSYFMLKPSFIVFFTQFEYFES
jgi:hypothetical protein